jgi:hypothetical protein
MTFSGSILVIYSIPLVDAPVLVVFRIGPIIPHAKMNAITLINVDMPRKPSDMAPAATIVMVVVAGSIIEIDTDRRVVIVIVPGRLVGDDCSHIR